MDKDKTCTLMHKHIPVVEMELDEATGFVRKLGAVHASEHLPVGVICRNGIVDRRLMNDWWTERSIPASRSGVREALEKLEIADTRMLLVRCYGLSLSDQYWIRPIGTELQWEDINFFQKDFSEDIGDVLFGTDKNVKDLDFFSPDNTTDGNLKKRWKIIDGKRCLMKGGSDPFWQQPFNEVIATGIMERMGVAHVPYRLVWNQGVPYSVCEDFVDENTELIPAWRILGVRKKNNSRSMYQHFLDCSAALGIRDVVPFLDRMITVDYILANEDRHFNNFGALRNAETLEWIGMAPIYDSGSSLGYDKMPVQMRLEKEVVCKPFKNHHIEQLKLVTSFDWLDLSRLSDVGDFITDVFSDENAADYIDQRRIMAIRDSVQRRIGNLSEIVQSFRGRGEITVEDDVKENIAAEYGFKTCK